MKPLHVQTMPGKRLANLTSTETKGGGYDPKKVFNSPAPPHSRRATDTQPVARGVHGGTGPRASTANPAKHKRVGTGD